MRILLVNKFYSLRGGAERCLFDQERWLRQAGHEVHVFSQRDAGSEPSEDASSFVESVRFDRSRSAALGGVSRLFWSERVKRCLTAVVERHRPEVAILHNVYHHLGPVVPLTLKALGVPSMLVLHDHKVVCPAYSAWRAGRRCTECSGQRFNRAALHGCGGSMIHGMILAAESYWQWDVLRSYERVQDFLAPSQYLRSTLQEMGFPFPVELVRNAVETPMFEPPRFEARGVIGFAGRLSPEKGVDVLIRAAARLPHIRFRVAGDGPARASLEALAHSVSADNLTFLGHVRRPELDREIASWRMAIVPSLSPENAPYAALDAMNHRVPVVGSAIGGLPELLAERGVTFNPGDWDELAQRIAQLYPDQPRLETLAARAREFIDAECRPEAHVSRLLSLAKRAMP